MKQLRNYGLCKCGNRLGDYKSIGCASCYHKSRTGKPRYPLKERFFKYVNKTASCWLWTGGSSKYRYGGLKVNGRMMRINRVAWELFKGKIPPGKYVLHKCDNTKCVNPAHLWLGNQKENVLDMEAKGRARHPNGEDAGPSKLTAKKVMAIRKSYPEKSLSYLGRKFHVAHQTISAIVKRKTWRHVTAT
jgi:hypothetical protein